MGTHIPKLSQGAADVGHCPRVPPLTLTLPPPPPARRRRQQELPPVATHNARRVQWQEDFDCITPSLLAFYLKDTLDLLLRLEYLAATRASPDSGVHALGPAGVALMAGECGEDGLGYLAATRVSPVTSAGTRAFGVAQGNGEDGCVVGLEPFGGVTQRAASCARAII